MKLKSILRTFASVAGSLNPALGGAISLVNGFLPDDKKLLPNATGNDVETALADLPPDLRAQIHDADVELKIVESNNFVEIQKALADADSKGSSTRPEIAKLMAYTVFLSIMPISCALTYSIVNADFETVREIGDAYPVVLALIGTPTALLNSYFGKRTKEKEARIQAAHGQSVGVSGSGVMGLITGFLGKK